VDLPQGGLRRPPRRRLHTGRGYAASTLDDRNRYYYRRVYLGCLRANDFLVSHPKWTRKNLIVTGGSQGGR